MYRLKHVNYKIFVKSNTKSYNLNLFIVNLCIYNVEQWKWIIDCEQFISFIMIIMIIIL